MNYQLLADLATGYPSYGQATWFKFITGSTFIDSGHGIE